MIPLVTVAGLELWALLLLLFTWALPVIAYILYRIDVKRNDGRISILGMR